MEKRILYEYEGHGKAYTPRYNVLRTAQNCIISFSTMNVEHVESRFRYNEIRRFQLSFSDHVKSDKSSPRIQNLATVWQYQLYSISITSWIANATTWLECPVPNMICSFTYAIWATGFELRPDPGPSATCLTEEQVSCHQTYKVPYTSLCGSRTAGYTFWKDSILKVAL